MSRPQDFKAQKHGLASHLAVINQHSQWGFAKASSLKQEPLVEAHK